MCFPVTVSCYASHRASVRPVVFTRDGVTHRVDTVLDQWHGPDHRYFKIRAQDGAVFLLQHALETDEWELIYPRLAAVSYPTI